MELENSNSILSICANGLLSVTSGAIVRDEITAWVTLLGSIAITLTTIGIQVYHLIRDRDKDNKPADAENKDKENDEKNG